MSLLLNSFTAQSIRCLSCQGVLNTKCENTSTEIECKPSGQLVYDSCYTVTRIMDYPFIGRIVENIKNCSVLAHCTFLETLQCDNTYGFVNACSIQCCTGNLCNNKTLQPTRSSVTRGTNVSIASAIACANITRAITSHVKLTRALKISLPPSSTTRISKPTKTNISSSWTFVKTQRVLFSGSLRTTQANTDKVQAVSSSGNIVFIQFHFFLLTATSLGSGIINHVRFWPLSEQCERNIDQSTT